MGSADLWCDMCGKQTQPPATWLSMTPKRIKKWVVNARCRDAGSDCNGKLTRTNPYLWCDTCGILFGFLKKGKMDNDFGIPEMLDTSREQKTSEGDEFSRVEIIEVGKVKVGNPCPKHVFRGTCNGNLTDERPTNIREIQVIQDGIDFLIEK